MFFLFCGNKSSKGPGIIVVFILCNYNQYNVDWICLNCTRLIITEGILIFDRFNVIKSSVRHNFVLRSTLKINLFSCIWVDDFSTLKFHNFFLFELEIFWKFLFFFLTLRYLTWYFLEFWQTFMLWRNLRNLLEFWDLD